MKKHTPEEIIPKLRVAELDWAAGLTIGQVCQKLGVSEQTFHRWRNQCRVLAGVVRERDAPKHIRSDNGPEFITRVMRAWTSEAGLETWYIEPDASWENG
jgi:transposase-like protein